MHHSTAVATRVVRTVPRLESIRTAEEYRVLIDALYARVKPLVQELTVPPIHAICVEGDQPPPSQQYQDAIGALYGIGYGLKMGWKFGKLATPTGYFDYPVGALETLWWAADGGALDITHTRTLRWRAYLMVPAFVTAAHVAEARTRAAAAHRDTDYSAVTRATIREGRSVQTLHVGRYDEEQPTIATLHAYAAAHGLRVTGRQHEIYISDPRRTHPERLKTVIRFAVQRA